MCVWRARVSNIKKGVYRRRGKLGGQSRQHLWYYPQKRRQPTREGG